MSCFYLKIIALILMFLDHTGEFFPDIIPIFFRWAGRLSAPIFIFCLVQGLVHTKSRKKYLLRLYIGSVIMGFGNIILNMIYNHSPVPITNNIFATLFLVAVIITAIESTRSMRKKLCYIFLLIVMQIVIISATIILVSGMFGGLNSVKAACYCYGVGGFFPNVVFCDGSFLWVILGTLMYWLRDRRRSFIIMYSIFSLLQPFFTVSYGFNLKVILFINYQWMMLGALPILLAYNGFKGKSFKYFFYIFYPIHIWVLFIISNFI